MTTPSRPPPSESEEVVIEQPEWVRDSGTMIATVELQRLLKIEALMKRAVLARRVVLQCLDEAGKLVR